MNRVACVLVVRAVRLAGLVWNTILVDLGVGDCWIPSLAVPPVLAVDQHLWGEVYRWKDALVHQGQAVGQSGSHRLCPAASAVPRRVLVLVFGPVRLHALDVSDVVTLWQNFTFL